MRCPFLMGYGTIRAPGGKKIMFLRIPLRILQGCFWGSVLVHASGLWGPVLKRSRSPAFARGQSEAEQMALGLAALVTVAVEPLVYLLYTVRLVDDLGWVGFFLLAPLALTHLASWLMPPARTWAKRIAEGRMKENAK